MKNTSRKSRKSSKRKKMASSDENVVRTRLLLDGDGTGDDRRLNNIAKSVRKRQRIGLSSFNT